MPNTGIYTLCPLLTSTVNLSISNIELRKFGLTTRKIDARTESERAKREGILNRTAVAGLRNLPSGRMGDETHPAERRKGHLKSLKALEVVLVSGWFRTG
jgi:hypothetical protein